MKFSNYLDKITSFNRQYCQSHVLSMTWSDARLCSGIQWSYFLSARIARWVMDEMHIQYLYRCVLGTCQNMLKTNFKILIKFFTTKQAERNYESHIRFLMSILCTFDPRWACKRTILTYEKKS